jgi:hypothetical protein
MKPPTLNEVTAYCAERQNGIDPEAWFAYYESVGWKIGKKPMVNWKMAVITWEKRAKPKQPNIIDRIQDRSWAD